MARIGVDIDNTIGNTCAAMLRELKRMGIAPPNVTVKDVQWYFMEYNPETGTGFPWLTPEDTKKLFMNREFWYSIPIYANLRPILQALARKHEVHYLTDRRWYTGIDCDTVFWLHSREVPYKELVCIKGKEKYKYVRDNELDYMVEDSPLNVQTIAPVTKKTFLLDRPWNKNIIVPENCIKCNWKQIAQELL